MYLSASRILYHSDVFIYHKSFRQECMAQAKDILVKNCFPSKVIEQLIHQVNGLAHAHSSNRDKSYAFMDQTTLSNVERLNISNVSPNSTLLHNTTTSTPVAGNHQPKEKKVYAGLTYIPKLTEQVTKLIKKHVPNLCAAPRLGCKVGILFTDMKEKLRVGQNSMVVYDIPCEGCHGTKGYLGETTWTVDGRCGPPGGHARDLKNIEKSPRSTALVHHVATTQHQFQFAEKRIIKKVRHQGILKIHETNQILLHEGYSVNFKKDAEHVTPMFYNLLQQSVRNERSKMKSKCKPRITCKATPKYKY